MNTTHQTNPTQSPVAGHGTGSQDDTGRAVCTTIPARDSFEERQYELVRRGLMSLHDAQQRVEGYRERRRLSVARFVGGAA